MKQLILTIFIFSLAINCFSQWTEQTSGVTTSLNSVSAIDSNNVWICGAGGKVLLTTNGGSSWIAKNSPNPVLNLNVIWGLDANNALVAGSSNTIAYIYKTSNSGANWIQALFQPNGNFRTLTKIMINPNQYICLLIGDPVGGRWSVWSSSDDGNNWDSTGNYFPQQGSEQGYYNSYFMNYHEWNSHSHFYWGTNSSRIHYGQAQTWDFSPTQSLPDIYCIYFIDEIQGFAGGSGFNRTSNGGSNWTSVTLPGAGICYGIVGTNQELWYCRGTAGSSGIYYSSNSGTNFASAYTAPDGYYIHMAKARNGIVDFGQKGYIWAIRNNGGISRLVNPIGIQNISSEVPAKFRLEQNYPNPFNPITKIRYGLANDNYVSLTMYDVLGNEIAKLVDQKQNAGLYQIEWNASDYPSGVYFYRLTAGDFTETKKLVLIK